MKSKAIFLSLILMAASASLISTAQTPDEQTRKLWDTAFITPAASKKTAGRRRRSGAYRVATPNVPVDNVAPDTVVGVTIWRLRPANRADSGERLIVHDDKATMEWLPERISPATKLAQGDRLRIAVEAVRGGYLYVINREQYADGTLGDPYLIFPTTRTAGGDIEIGLTYIYGIGQATSNKILETAGVNPDRRVHELNDDEVNRLRRIIESQFKVEGALRTEVSMNIKRLMDIGAYRGLRHRKGLPVRGQRTHTNARTLKGKRVAIAGKKKATKK